MPMIVWLVLGALVCVSLTFLLLQKYLKRKPEQIPERITSRP